LTLRRFPDIRTDIRGDISVLEPNQKRAKFVKFAEGRTQAALSAIRKIGHLSNRRSYEWDDADIRKISKALKDAIAEVERRFDPQGVAEKSFKL
jgi:hypothetical protein